MIKKEMVYEKQQEEIFKKSRIMDGIILAAGVCAMVMFGLTAEASVPEDIWEYTTGTNADGSIFCDFKEVEVTLPSHWGGKCGISRSTDAVSFYHLSSRNAYKEDGISESGGLLFTICWSEDYGFTQYLPDYEILGEGASGIYFVEFPTDVQGYMDDSTIWTEWQSLVGNVDWIVENMGVVPYEETTYEYTDLNSYANPNDYIVEDSSSRVIEEWELEDMDAIELQMAINEIYARHHRKFVMTGVQAYFNSKSWYTGTVEAANFDTSVMSQIEWKNIELMLKLMEQRK